MFTETEQPLPPPTEDHRDKSVAPRVTSISTGVDGRLTSDRLREFERAAKCDDRVSGATHQFYRYPARFSPIFARSAIELFSSEDDRVLDPYMGGGTTIVEAAIAGRKAVGIDLNELAVFVTKAKTTSLTTYQRMALMQWAETVLGTLSFWDTSDTLESVLCERRTRNLNLPIARPIKKYIALALTRLNELPGEEARTIARCALLNVGQWALNGRSKSTPLAEFRQRVKNTVYEMVKAEEDFSGTPTIKHQPVILTGNSADLPSLVESASIDLVVTSPPYPGIHILYHRWQVDGRRESPAPYWISGCNDGKGTSYYNFADRKGADDNYFNESLRTLRGIRTVMKETGYFVQMIAFSDPSTQLPRYLDNMRAAGFEEVRANEELNTGKHRRIWRDVPRRSWHATLKGETSSSREVVLIHRCA